VQWNIFAWLAWGILVVAIRYGAERRSQIAERAAAMQAIEAGAMEVQ
jgi:heme exporter protein C